MGMDSAGASRTLHAVTRLLVATGLVALLALALGAGTARAQVPGPSAVPPGQETPENGVHEEGEAGAWDGDDSDWQDDAPGLVPLLPGVLPPAGRGNGARPFLEGEEELLPAVTSTFVRGRVARMRTDGKAAIPRGAPKRVRSLIAQYNRIVGKRYKWGGGHARLADTGYDCSGAVGFGLIRNGLQRTPMVSGSYARWGAAGAGRWVTVYAHQEHVYVEVAGLRLDTSAVGDRAGGRGVRWRTVIGQRPGFKVRHPVGL